MPFKGIQSKFSPIEIALQIREIRKRDAADAERMRLEQERFRFDRIKSLNDARDSELKRQKMELEMMNARADLASKMDPLAGGVAAAQRNLGAKFTSDDLSIPASGSTANPFPNRGSESDIFANLVAQDAPTSFDNRFRPQEEMQAKSVLRDRVQTAAQSRQALTGGSFESNEASVLGAADVASREEERSREITFKDDKRRLILAERIAQRQAQAAEDRAIGKEMRWTGSDLQNYSEKISLDLKPLLNTERQRMNVARMDFTNPVHVLEAMTVYIKNTDDAGVVRTQDIDMLTALAVPTMDLAFAKLKGLANSKELLPAEVGKVVKEALLRQNDVIDEVLVDKYDDHVADLTMRIKDDKQRTRALPQLSGVERARKRIEERAARASEPVGDFRMPTDKDMKEVNARAAKLFGVKPSEVTAEQATNVWHTMYLSGYLGKKEATAPARRNSGGGARRSWGSR